MRANAAAAAGTGTIEKRRHRRRRVWLAVMLRTAGAEMPGWIRDLSCKGAMIETDASILPGDGVVLLRKAIETEAAVAWARGRLMGVIFAEPFTEKDLVEYSLPRAKRRVMRSVHGLRRGGGEKPIASGPVEV